MIEKSVEDQYWTKCNHSRVPYLIKRRRISVCLKINLKHLQRLHEYPPFLSQTVIKSDIDVANRYYKSPLPNKLRINYKGLRMKFWSAQNPSCTHFSSSTEGGQRSEVRLEQSPARLPVSTQEFNSADNLYFRTWRPGKIDNPSSQ